MAMPIRLGLQIYSVREAFAEDPLGTLKTVAAMGFEGVELTTFGMNRPAQFYADALAETGLACLGCLTNWQDVQPEAIEATLAAGRILGSPFIVVGSVPVGLVSTREDAQAVIASMRDIHTQIKAAGFAAGYHNHDTDFTNILDGQPFFYHVMDQTPKDFVMLLDTGNALAAGYAAIDLLRRYPGRSPFMHIKGYSTEKDYLAWIGQDDIDWPATLRCAIELGGARSFSIELCKRGGYDPFERSKTSLDRVRQFLWKIYDSGLDLL